MESFFFRYACSIIEKAEFRVTLSLTVPHTRDHPRGLAEPKELLDRCRERYTLTSLRNLPGMVPRLGPRNRWVRLGRAAGVTKINYSHTIRSSHTMYVACME